MAKAKDETMTIENRPILELKPHPKNYKVHTDEQLEVIANSLKIHGAQKPVVITAEGMILAGHGVVEAAKRLGWLEIPCHVYTGDQPEAFLAIDNRTSQLGIDDEAKLLELLAEVDLEAAGFDQVTVDMMADFADLWESEPAEKSGDRQLGDRKRSVKVVIYCDELATVERALRETGNPNRGEALVQICKAYLNEEG